MRFLAAWLYNPEEYWPNILLLICVVAVGVWIVRKIQARKKA
jgi:hypothetical protein